MSKPASSTAEDRIITKTSPRSVTDTVTRLTELVASKGMTVFAIIDNSGDAHKIGLELRDTKVVLFGSPASGTPVMVAAPLAALDLPLRVLVWADYDQTRISYLDPLALAARYQFSDELAARLTGINAITDALIR